jgi:hypothetical protein
VAEATCSGQAASAASHGRRAARPLLSPIVFVDAYGRPQAPPPPPPPRSLSATFSMLTRTSSSYCSFPRSTPLASAVSVDTLLQHSLAGTRTFRKGSAAPRLQHFNLASPFGEELPTADPCAGAAPSPHLPHQASVSHREESSTASCAIDVPVRGAPSLLRAEGSEGSVLGSYSMWLDKGNIWQCPPALSGSPC